MPNQNVVPGTTKWGSWKVTKKLGVGGMGEVWELDHLHDPQWKAAGKMLIAMDANIRDKFLAEKRLYTAIRHQSVPQIYDFLTFNGRPVIIMELIEGGDLSKAIMSMDGKPRPLKEEQILWIAREMCDVLNYLHNKVLLDGKQMVVIHRDIKPENIKVNWTNPPVLKLMDLGLASLKELLQHALVGSVASIVGTPQYGAPEQWQGEPPTPATDLFGLGAVLFECVFGRQFNPQRQGMLLNAPPTPFETRHEKVIADRLRTAQISAKLQELICRCLRYEQKDRFQSANEMLNALGTGATQGAPVAASNKAQVPSQPPGPSRNSNISHEGINPASGVVGTKRDEF